MAITEFIPYDYKLTTPSLYGLDSFEMHELAALPQKERVLIPLNPEKEKKTYEISINRTFLRNAAAMIAAIVLFFCFFHSGREYLRSEEQLRTVVT